MNLSTVSIPESLYTRLKQLSEQAHCTVDQFVASAVAEKMSAIEKDGYIAQRARRADEKKFREALAQIPDIEPEDYDRI